MSDDVLRRIRRAEDLLGCVLDVIDMSNPEHKNYNDCSTDIVDALCMLEEPIRHFLKGGE